MNENRSFTFFELLVVICLIFVLLGTFAGYAAEVLKIAKETALRNELTNIRMAIEHFRIINNRYPQDLKELVNKRLTKEQDNIIITQRKYIEPFRLDIQGYLLDPFMNRYEYNVVDGQVHSSTKDFLLW